MLCSNLESVSEGCRQREGGDPNVDPIDNVGEGEVAMYLEGGS